MAKRAPDPTDARLDALHATPPDEFVAKRNALARELAAAHDPRAAAVRELGRPTLPVWAIDLAARDEAPAIEALVTAGEQVVRAHRLVLGGASGEELLRANRALGAALERAVGSAARLARDRGHPLSISMSSRVRSTLRSMAAGDAAAREMLRSGRVLVESAATGLEALEGLSPAPATASGTHGEPAWKRRARERAAADRARADAAKSEQEAGERETKEREAKDRAARAEAARARAALAEARQSARTAERELGRSEADASRLRRELEGARRRVDEVEGRLREAEARVADARRRIEEARRIASRLQGG